MAENQDEKTLVVQPEVLPAKPEKSTAVAEPKADPLAWLAPDEQYALKVFQQKFRRGGAETYPLADSVAEGMFALYLQGKTLAEIRRLQPQYGMGQIVHAALTSNWPERRQRELERVLAEANVAAKQAAGEGALLARDLIVAMKKLHGDNIARFLATGDINHLGGALAMSTIKNLKELAEVLSKFTGQDQVKKVKVSGVVEHQHRAVPPPQPLPPIAAPVAAATLAAWAAEETKKQDEEAGE